MRKSIIIPSIFYIFRAVSPHVTFYKSQNDVYFNDKCISNIISLPKINQVTTNFRDCDSPATIHITTVYK